MLCLSCRKKRMREGGKRRSKWSHLCRKRAVAISREWDERMTSFINSHVLSILSSSLQHSSLLLANYSKQRSISNNLRSVWGTALSPLQSDLFPLEGKWWWECSYERNLVVYQWQIGTNRRDYHPTSIRLISPPSLPTSIIHFHSSRNLEPFNFLNFSSISIGDLLISSQSSILPSLLWIQCPSHPFVLAKKRLDPWYLH